MNDVEGRETVERLRLHATLLAHAFVQLARYELVYIRKATEALLTCCRAILDACTQLTKYCSYMYTMYVHVMYSCTLTVYRTTLLHQFMHARLLHSL